MRNRARSELETGVFLDMMLKGLHAIIQRPDSELHDTHPTIPRSSMDGLRDSSFMLRASFILSGRSSDV